MGIADRDYYRDRPRGRGGRGGGFGGGYGGPGGGVARLSGWSVNTWIIVVNVAIFVIQMFLPRNIIGYGTVQFGWPMDVLQTYGHFSTVLGFQKYEVWRLITFQFLHGNLMHLFFNMFGLFIFGSIVEQYLGRRRYLAFYLICGIFGGLAYLLLNLIGWWLFKDFQITFPGLLINHPSTPLIGASAGVFGVIMACAYIAPNAIVQLILPPIPIRLKWFAYGYVGLAFVSLLAGASNQGGHAAHLGGAVAGFFFIRNAHLLSDFFDVFRNSSKQDRPPRAGGRRSGSGSRGRVAGGPADAEIDRILGKVATEGVQSLTEAERRTLAARTEAERRNRA